MAGPKAQERLTFTAFPPGVPTIVGSEGVELITADGTRILDGAGGAVVNNIGYGRTEVADAVAAAMRENSYVLPLWPTPNRLELADLLVEQWLPEGFEHVFFAGGGSEANESAIRLARLYHLSRGDQQRYKIIGRLPSYHGATLTTLAVGGHTGRRAGFEPYLPDWPQVTWNDADALAKAIEAAGPETVAAFIAEPMIGAAAPGLIAPPEYWARVSEICRHYGVLMIADEVMTGFGRTGKRWGHEHGGWKPDILVSAKGMGGGYVPISLLSAGNHVLDPVTEAGELLMFFTFGAHDSMCAGALEVLRIVEREGLVAQAAARGDYLMRLLQDALGDHPGVSDVRGQGLMIGVELAGLSANTVVAHALWRQLWVYPGAAAPGAGEALLLAPPLVISEAQLQSLVDRLRQAIDAAMPG